MEEQIRIAAFNWLEQQTAIHGDVLPYHLLMQGFIYQDQRVTIIGQQGIWNVFCKLFFPVFANFPCNNPAREFMRSLSSMIS